MKLTIAFLMSLICFQLDACNKNSGIGQTNNPNSNTDTTKMKITIGTNIFSATFYNNATATEFKSRLPMTFNMTELNGNEKYFILPNTLSANASKPETIQNGDFMLYGTNTLVLFYKTFSTSYSYTRIGRFDNPSGLATALGSGNALVTFEAD